MDDKFRAKKSLEGDTLMQSGEKFLETSIWKLKTSPDFDSAAADFEKALTCYKLAKEIDKAIQAALKSAQCYLKTNQEFHSAKMVEQVAVFYRDKNDMKNCSKYIEQCSNHYRNCGEIDSAYQCYDKLAKSIDQSPTSTELHKLAAVSMLQKAFDVGRISNRPHEATQCLDYASKILLSLKKYEESLQLVERSWNFYEESGNSKMLFRVGLHYCLLSLQLGKIGQAREMSQKMLNVDEELAGELNMLVKAFESGDQKSVSQITMGQNFVYTENEFAKLGTNLRVNEDLKLRFEKSGGQPIVSQMQSGDSGANGVNPNADYDEDDLS